MHKLIITIGAVILVNTQIDLLAGTDEECINKLLKIADHIDEYNKELDLNINVRIFPYDVSLYEDVFEYYRYGIGQTRFDEAFILDLMELRDLLLDHNTLDDAIKAAYKYLNARTVSGLIDALRERFEEPTPIYYGPERLDEFIELSREMIRHVMLIQIISALKSLYIKTGQSGNEETYEILNKYHINKDTWTKQELKDYKNKLVDSINIKAILAGFDGMRFLRDLGVPFREVKIDNKIYYVKTN